MSKRDEVRAVRRVLYDRQRLRGIFTHLESIDELMNLDPGNVLAPNDPRVEGGSGPYWFIPANGQLSPAVVEAAERCDKVAGLLLDTRRELSDVKFDGDDKRALRAALQEQAESWRERGKVWRAPGRPEVGVALDRIAKHDKESLRELKKVKEYLQDVDPRDFR